MKSAKKYLLWVIRNIEELVSSAALLVMIGIITVNVLCRYILKSPIHWAEELAVIALAWATFIGSAVCFKRQAHLGMDFLITHLPRRGRRLMQQFIMLALFCFFVFITYLATDFALNTQKTTPYFKLNYGYVYISVALGFLSMSVYSLIYFVMSFAAPKKFDDMFVGETTEGE